MLLKDPGNIFHRTALILAMLVGRVSAVIQPVSGDMLAKTVAENQPLKLAAFEGQFETEKGAPLRIGGIPDAEKEETRFAIEIPKALSFLTYNDFNAEVKGLKDFPKDLWPPLGIVHYSFQVMVVCGLIMILTAFVSFYLFILKKHFYRIKWFLWMVILSAPLGFISIEAGWFVTEVGRQPWIIYGVMKTADAVTPMPGLLYTFITFTSIYLFLGVIVVVLLLRQFRSSPGFYDEEGS